MFDIAVVGCGVVGLNSALAVQGLLGSKANVTIFTEKLSPDTTGDIAAGLWTPYILENTPKVRVHKWAKITQDYILKLWKEGLAQEAGICLQPVLCLEDQVPKSQPDWLDITLGYSLLSQRQLNYYNNLHKQNFSYGYSYVTFSWEASKFLPFLQEKFLHNGGQIKIKSIKRLDELANFDAVVNCTGLYSRDLVPDSLVKPVRGQVIRVHAPWQFHSVFYTTATEDPYIIPNQDSVVLGGTHQEWNFNQIVDEGDRKRILEKCCKYIPPLEKAVVIKNSVGLRPGRVEVRLELEERQVGEKMLKIIHNYGHGGSGITLAVGCGLEAAQLVKMGLGLDSVSKL